MDRSRTGLAADMMLVLLQVSVMMMTLLERMCECQHVERRPWWGVNISFHGYDVVQMLLQDGDQN